MVLMLKTYPDCSVLGFGCTGVDYLLTIAMLPWLTY